MDKVLNAETFNYEAMTKYKNLIPNKNDKALTTMNTQQLNKTNEQHQLKSNKKLAQPSNNSKPHALQPPSDNFSIYDPNNTARMRQTLDVLVSQLHRTESEIDRQRLKIALKKKTKNYMHDK